MWSDLANVWRERCSGCPALARVGRIVQCVCIIRKRVLSNAQTFARSLQGYSLEDICGGVHELPSPLDADDNSIDGPRGPPKDIPLEMLIEQIRRRGMNLRQSQIPGWATLLSERAANLATWNAVLWTKDSLQMHMQLLSQGKAKIRGLRTIKHSLMAGWRVLLLDIFKKCSCCDRSFLRFSRALLLLMFAKTWLCIGYTAAVLTSVNLHQPSLNIKIGINSSHPNAQSEKAQVNMMVP